MLRRLQEWKAGQATAGRGRKTASAGQGVGPQRDNAPYDRGRWTGALLLLTLLAACSGGPAVSGPMAVSAGRLPLVQGDGTLEQGEPGAFEVVGENETLVLSADPVTLAFTVEDKRSGYVWRSNLTEVTDDDDLNRTWTAFAQSGISIDYLDATAEPERASLTRAEHTLDYRRIDQGFEAVLTFTEPGITLGVRVRLEADGVSVEVPFDSIVQGNSEYRLGQVHVYPFFGAVREDARSGYMFLPDGAGSLIDFAVTSKAEAIFRGRYYGADLGMTADVPWSDTTLPAYTLSVPVIGMVHGEGEHGYLAIVERGAAHGEAQAHLAGVITRFNFLYNVFIYNESYFRATNRSGAGVTALQPNTNPVDVRLMYRFLNGAESDVVGLANSYRAYLIARGALPEVVTPAGELPIRLEFLAGEREPFLLWQRFVPMTTVAEMEAILDDLALPASDVVVYGWQPMGASALAPETFQLEAQLGRGDALLALGDRVIADGGQFGLYYNPQAAIRDEPGYSPRNDLALTITDLSMRNVHRWTPFYFFSQEAQSRRYSALSGSIFSQGRAGLALDGVGAIVHSDFRPGAEVDRTAAVARYQALFADAGAQGRLAFYRPNDYLFSAMRAYYDMPLSNSGYVFASRSAPFLPIVLAGRVPAYGPALNFSSDIQADLLRLVDYGVYPSYFLSQGATAEIINTRSAWIYSSSYAQWEDEIRRAYAWLAARLGPVRGQAVVARQTLAPGVVAITYTSNVRLVVNHTEQPFSRDGLEVPARDAIVTEVGP